MAAGAAQSFVYSNSGAFRAARFLVLRALFHRSCGLRCAALPAFPAVRRGFSLADFRIKTLETRRAKRETFAMPHTAIYPGSFDPVTNGHLDVIERATRLFDRVIVAVAHNEQKKPLFSAAERLALIQRSIPPRPGVEVTSFAGLLVDFAREQKAHIVVRGLRAISDFEFEFQMALMNRKLHPDLETCFLTPKEELTYLSSRMVKEIARLGGDITGFVSAPVAQALTEKFAPVS